MPLLKTKELSPARDVIRSVCREIRVSFSTAWLIPTKRLSNLPRWMPSFLGWYDKLIGRRFLNGLVRRPLACMYVEIGAVPCNRNQGETRHHARRLQRYPSRLASGTSKAATPKSEVKRHGALGYSSDCMPVVPGSYSASNFA